MDRCFRFDFNRMSLCNNDGDLVFFLLNSSFLMRSLGNLMRRYCNIVLRSLVMYGYFLMSYNGLCRSLNLLDYRLLSMMNSHWFFMLFLIYFMGYSLMLNGSLDRDIVVYRSIFMDRYSFRFLNYWMLIWCLLWSHFMLYSLLVFGSLVMLSWSLIVSCYCFGNCGHGFFLVSGCNFLFCLRKQFEIERFRHFNILEIVI